MPDRWGPCTTTHGAPGHWRSSYGLNIQQGPKAHGPTYWNLTCVSNTARVLKPKHSGLCATVTPEAAPSNGRVLVQGACTGDLYSLFERKSTGDGYYWLVVAATGKCLAVHDASTSWRALVVQADCGSGTHRQWRLNDVGGNYYEIKARHSNLCLDVEDDSLNPGVRVWQYKCGGGDNQRFLFVDRVPVVQTVPEPTVVKRPS